MEVYPAMELVVTSAEKPRTHIPLDHACSVCSAPASAHHHYGAVVCYPCRAFFRRGTTKEFTCITGYQGCPVDMSVKNRCRGCRYAKCLEVGMRPELVDATLLRKNPDHRRGKPMRKPSSSGGGVVAAADNAIAQIMQQRKIGADNSPLDLSKGGEGGEEQDEDAEATTTQMFYVFNPPTQTYEPVTIISLGEEEEQQQQQQQVMEDTERLVEEVLQEAEQAIFPRQKEEAVEEEKMFKEELVEGFHQDVEREEIVSDSVPVLNEEINV